MCLLVGHSFPAREWTELTNTGQVCATFAEVLFPSFPTRTTLLSLFPVMANASEVLEGSFSFPSSKTFVLVEDLFYEILMLVGVKIEDMTWLWTTGREVSRAFKDATERVFIERHLKYTYLTANLAIGGTVQYSSTRSFSSPTLTLLTAPVPSSARVSSPPSTTSSLSTISSYVSATNSLFASLPWLYISGTTLTTRTSRTSRVTGTSWR
ncbi:hypothetical protein BXZ70DRAFT_52549 [Cristinia sonorae]|uniref:Uncharacterized protein n=1 Tax=Cristinia sonorae TaxID=1940300 RepID=A0A8K0URY3_9AGAR|nr:hypothetical protein BXZ70DRAFT_52549 [Cristinia sonorae]